MNKKELTRSFISILIGAGVGFVFIIQPIDFYIDPANWPTMFSNDYIATVLLISLGKVPTTFCCAVVAAMFSSFLPFIPLLYSMVGIVTFYLAFIVFTVYVPYEVEVMTINWLLFLIFFSFAKFLIKKIIAPSISPKH